MADNKTQKNQNLKANINSKDNDVQPNTTLNLNENKKRSSEQLNLSKKRITPKNDNKN